MDTLSGLCQSKSCKNTQNYYNSHFDAFLGAWLLQLYWCLQVSGLDKEKTLSPSQPSPTKYQPALYCMPGCRCYRLDPADRPSIATFCCKHLALQVIISICPKTRHFLPDENTAKYKATKDRSMIFLHPTPHL